MAQNRGHELQGQVAIITGAGRGIGAAIALGLAELGATAVLCGRNRKPLDATAANVVSAGGKAIVLECDVTNLRSVERAVEEVEATLRRVDVLVNNAGIGDSEVHCISWRPRVGTPS
jgi:NAD(P)-dependent dehydrogenase (short-subunit alcohol dehydrogenase family)